jgi:hypothetical protein
MVMHEDELRALIRESIARHLGGEGGGRSPNGPIAAAGTGPMTSARSATAPYLTHLSHGRFVFLEPTEPDAPCVVEPQVRCHHCGFCQSYGH